MKRLTVLAIILAIALASCGENSNVGKGSALPSETTQTTAAETTVSETVTEEPTLPEFDINSEECLMYRLLEMTVEEIEEEFGMMTFCGLVGGGSPCYEIPEIGIQLLYHWETQDLENPVLEDQYPIWAETDGYDSVAYPGIYVGMDSKEFIDTFSVDELSYSMADFFSGFSSSCWYGENRITVLWSVPEELSLEVEEAILWGEDGEGNAAKAELLAKMKKGDANVTVGRITISKGD